MSTTTTTNPIPPIPPPTSDHYAALTALHTHYRTLVAGERETMTRERALWESERALFLSRIRELETAPTNHAAPAPAPPALPQQENTRPKPVFALDNGDDEDEISPEEMRQLLREATRIVYPISHSRPRGQSLAEPVQGGVGVPGRLEESESEDEGEKIKEEVVELRLKKTSNFGTEFGRWR